MIDLNMVIPYPRHHEAGPSAAHRLHPGRHRAGAAVGSGSSAYVLSGQRRVAVALPAALDTYIII